MSGECSYSSEMSLNNEEASEPHAYVKFVDGEKESVPISFIENFPLAWRKPADEEGGWNKNRLYKVFWSPDDRDTPRKMLQRVAEIPLHERGTSMGTAGYYRAAVVAVKDSLTELENSIDEKRVSFGNMLLKETSFDKGQIGRKRCSSSAASAGPEKRTEVARQDHKQPLQACNKTSQDKKKHTKKDMKPRRKGGLNVPAQIKNTCDLRLELADLVPDPHSSAQTEASDKEIASNPSTSNKRGCAIKNNTPKTSNISLKFTKKKKRSLKPFLSSDSSSSSDNAPLISKKRFKLDPDFSPLKHEQLKEDLQIQKSTVQKIQSLNIRLQENLNKALDINSQLELKVQQLLEQIDKMKVEKLDPIGLCETVFSQEEVHNSSCKESLNDSFSYRTMNGRQGVKVKNEEMKHSSEVTGEDTEDSANHKKHNAEEKSEMKNKYSLKVNSSDKPIMGKEQQHIVTSEIADNYNHDDIEQDTSDNIMAGITLSSEVISVIKAIPSGEKRDLRFIKDLAIAAFGPEILASSSIFGTAKGGRKKTGESEKKEKKSALCPTTLAAIKNALIKRVRMEEKLSELVDMQDNPRCSSKRFHEAIRGAQKRCREHGYGQGIKTNIVAMELLKE